MIIDVFKIIVWLIERYDLQEQVKEHLDSIGERKEEAIMVEPHKPYVIHFDSQYQAIEDLKDKILECTNLSEIDQRNQ